MFLRKFLHKRIYADAASATPLSKNAHRTLVRLLSVFGNPGALHIEAVTAKKELDSARESIAASLGAHADEIIFTSSGTEANNLALQGLLRPLLLKWGEVAAVRSAIEHQSVLEPLRALEREGLNVVEVGVDAQGLVVPEAVAEAISDETVLVSIQLVNSEVGSVQPIKEIAKIIRRVRALRQAKNKKEGAETLPLYFHTDAAQAPLWRDIKVDSLGVDLVTVDAQKIMGPKGVGALFVRRGVPLEPLLWGGMQERGYRAGTENIAQIGAFAMAFADAQYKVERRARNIAQVRDYLIAKIQKKLSEVVLNGPVGSDRVANNINVSILGLDGEMATLALDVRGVAVSVRSACSTGEEGMSHVFAALHASPERGASALRITLLPGATKRDARKIVEALLEVASIYRRVI